MQRSGEIIHGKDKNNVSPVPSWNASGRDIPNIAVDTAPAVITIGIIEGDRR